MPEPHDDTHAPRLHSLTDDERRERIERLMAEREIGEALAGAMRAAAEEGRRLAEPSARREQRREYAKAALIGLLAADHPTRDRNHRTDLAERAWQMADAMIEEERA